MKAKSNNKFRFKPNKRMASDGIPSEWTNKERTAAALAGVNSYCLALCKRDMREPETDTQDLLTDIMHLCDRKHWDFDELVRMARGNWICER